MPATKQATPAQLKNHGTKASAATRCTATKPARLSALNRGLSAAGVTASWSVSADMVAPEGERAAATAVLDCKSGRTRLAPSGARGPYRRFGRRCQRWLEMLK